MIAAETVQDDIAHALLQEAATLLSPVRVNGRWQNHWATLHARLAAVQHDQLCLGLDPTQSAPAWPVEQKLVLNLYWHKEKYLLPLRLCDMNTLDMVVEATGPLVRHNRRLFRRLPLPANRCIRAAFWLGGSESQPQGGSTVQDALYTGRVVDIGLGGVQIEAAYDAASMFDPGDILGLRLQLDDSKPVALLDARFRHVHLAGGSSALIGLEFLAINQDPQSILLVAHAVSELSRLQTEP